MLNDLLSVQSTVIDIVRQGGELLMRYFYQGHVKQADKALPTDLVTEADTALEAFITQALQGAFPGSHIVGEEGGSMGVPVDEADYRWYVDPLDGTVNFAYNIPYFSISIGLADRAMQPLVGVVYNPVADELFYGARGHGAYLNNRPLRVSTRESLGNALLSTGFGYDIWTNPDNNLSEFSAFSVRVRGMRRMGSAALDLSYVAAGRYDGVWEHNLHPWDCMAALLFVLEAGGRITDFHGEQPDDLFTGREVVASNGLIHDAMIRVLTEVRRA